MLALFFYGLLVLAHAQQEVCAMSLFPGSFEPRVVPCSNPCCPEVLRSSDEKSLSGARWICFKLTVQLPDLQARIAKLEAKTFVLRSRLTNLPAGPQRRSVLFQLKKVLARLGRHSNEALQLVQDVHASAACQQQPGCPALAANFLNLTRVSARNVALDTQVISPISPIGIAFSALTLVMGVIVVIAGSRVAPVLYTAVLCGVILASALDVVWWTLALVGMSLASISPLVGRVLFRTSALVGLWTLVLLLLTWLEAVASVFSKQSSKKAMKPLAGAIVVSAVLVSLFSIGSGISVELTPWLDVSSAVIFGSQLLLCILLCLVFVFTMQQVKQSDKMTIIDARLAVLRKMLLVAVILALCSALACAIALWFILDPLTLTSQWVMNFAGNAVPTFVFRVAIIALIASLFFGRKSAKKSSGDQPLLERKSQTPERYSI